MVSNRTAYSRAKCRVSGIMAQNPWRLSHNTAGEEGVVRIVDAEARLNAGQIVAILGELGRRPAELGWVWDILGIKDRDKLAFGEAERIIEGAGLGLGTAARNCQYIHAGGEPGRAKRFTRLIIVGLRNNDDLDPVGGIVDRAHSLDQRRGNLLFAVDRHEDRIER